MTVEDVEAIVAAAKQPFNHHKEVAKLYRVPAQLVSGLVKEAEKKPEKLNQYREKELLHEQKRQAIEAATASMLQTNRPIVRA